jgi:hypothetical protein
MIVAPRALARATQPIGRRGDTYHLMTAVERSWVRTRTVQRPRLRPTWHRADRRASARDVVAGPHVGLQASSRSAAAGQNVGRGAEVPRAGPLRCLELAAADLGAAALALVQATALDMLTRFAFARHGNSLLIAIREVEFFAVGFFRRC